MGNTFLSVLQKLQTGSGVHPAL